ncbi:MAG: excinuclease ABC subunit UvrA [Opitutales bacterium]|nr:excinuclease ABC subunit UvrA [Opitutales bacterium]
MPKPKKTSVPILLSAESRTHIHVKGAREHNLKNVELTIPRNTLTVFTGVSGSGKSSLAFDTIYAEGARQYLESLSAKLRANMESIPHPDVDFIHGLSPVIAIEQHTSSGASPRSTVATVTEIADYARILWSVAGTQYCPDCGGKITSRSLDDCIGEVLAFPQGSRVLVGAFCQKTTRGLQAEVLEDLRRHGFQRVRLNGEVFDIDDVPAATGTKKALSAPVTIDVIVDRLVLREGVRSRLADSLELAFKEGRNSAFVLLRGPEEEDWREIPLRLDFSCSSCGKTYEPLTPKHFSTNHPSGACPTCGGLGTLPQFIPELVVPDPEKRTRDAIRPWNYGMAFMIIFMRKRWFRQLAKQYPFSYETKWKDQPEEVRNFILYGDPEREFSFRVGRSTQKRTWPGVLKDLTYIATTTESVNLRTRLLAYQHLELCPDCKGLRLNSRSLAVRLNDVSIGEFLNYDIEEALAYVKSLADLPELKAVEDARSGLEARLSFLVKTGLSYLTLNREYSTLSGGEIQRVRLAAQLGLGLVGVTYVLDEPSIGLHPIDNARLIDQLKGLRDSGNTVLVIEHDADMMRAADYIVETGEGAGPLGGNVVFSGTLKNCLKDGRSRTAKFLSKDNEIPRRQFSRFRQWLTVKDAREHNLKNITVSFPCGMLTGVCGVSGSGKSTLVNKILGNAAARRFNRAKVVPGKHGGIDGFDFFDGFVRVDQSPIGRSPRSNPATFTGIFDDLRKLFAGTPLAKARGYDAGRFSFNKKGGRCEKCMGDGQIALDMQFLGETWVTCPSCHGARYNRETLEVLYKGLNISQVLELTVDEAEEFFHALPPLQRVLQTLKDVGLGYLTLGQSATTLSGGEAQRLKLAVELAKNKRGKTLYILDEPTTGLHWDDIKKLMDVLFRLRDAGNTILIIEHNTDVLRQADYLVELGPTGGKLGGNVLFSGTPADLRSRKGETPTSRFI